MSDPVLALIPYPVRVEFSEGDGLTVPNEGLPSCHENLNDHLDLPQHGYRLQITESGATLESPDAAGLFHGRQTLKQLAAQARREDGRIPALSIIDFPRFPWRGAHLDVCRHFFSLDTVKAFIDRMALHKLNVFHWHLTEDQGWRLEIKKYPKLTEVGAWRTGPDGERYGGFFTQDEAHEVVAYAAERHITVVPEIEIPGHSIAALAAYPELGCLEKPMEVETAWGIFDDVYCPGKESVFRFFEDVLSEVCAIFPSTYIHIGGDECPKTRWKTCPLCQERMRAEGLASEEALQSYTIRRTEKFLLDQGRKLIGWDEILEGGLAPQATVMSWRGTEGGIAAASAGHDVIMTPNSHCYLDHKQIDDPAETVCRPEDVCTLQHCYTYEPVPPSLEGDQIAHVLGSQANVWTEYIRNPEELDYAVFPRLCALSEIFWSPKPQSYRSFREVSTKASGALPVAHE